MSRLYRYKRKHKHRNKVCKICGEGKPIDEFLVEKKNNKNYYNKCKVCGYLIRHVGLIIKDEWTLNEYRIILDNLLNKKVKCINEIASKLNNKTLDDIVNLLQNELKIAGKVLINIESNCPTCNKSFYLKLNQYTNNNKLHFCSTKCQSLYYGKIKSAQKLIYKCICQNCGNTFNVDSNRYNAGKNKYCSSKCSSEAQKSRIHYNCEYCNKECNTTPSEYNKTINHFCSHECADKFRADKHHITKHCEWCNKEFEVKLSMQNQRFCSQQCQCKWQSTIVGENNPRFTSQLIKCDWCGTEYYEKPYKINGQENHFCCKNCRQEWYAKIYSQTEEWKQQSRERAVQMLENGTFGNTDTEPQIVINNILNDLNIQFENEKGFKNCAVDNYLTDYNLIIEVMGTFWHCDNRIYSKINYANQVNRIKMDKSKHTYIKNCYNIEILYLWEYDIKSNIELCKQIILYYLNNNGKLNNYHSFNYYLDKNNILHLNDNIVNPYMEWNKKDLNEIIDIMTKEKISRKQVDKWTKYKCEYCGKETEMLTSHYNISAHHFCSGTCASKYHSKKVKVTCFNCNKEIEVSQSKYNKNKYFFCNKECQHEYQKRIGFKNEEDHIIYENNQLIKKIKKQVFFYCENCGKYSSKPTGDYNKSKHHFCTSECSFEYRKRQNNQECVNQ